MVVNIEIEMIAWKIPSKAKFTPNHITPNKPKYTGSLTRESHQQEDSKKSSENILYWDPL